MSARDDVVPFDERARLLAKLLADDQGDGEFYLGQLDPAVEYLTAAGVPALIAEVERLRQENARLDAMRRRAYGRMKQVLDAAKDLICQRDAALSRATVLAMSIERAADVLDEDPTMPPAPETAQQILATALEYERSSR